MHNVNDILFRCSSLGHIMTEPKQKKVWTLQGFEITPQKASKLLESGKVEGLGQKSVSEDDSSISLAIKKHLISVFANWKYNRKREINSKYMDKGNEMEKDSVTLLSLLTNVLYIENKKRITNDFITGLPDLITKEEDRIRVVDDIKTKWDYITFLECIHSPTNKIYEYQGHGYMDLTGADTFNLRHCLVNASPTLIDDEKRKLSYQLKLIDPEMSPDYVEKAKQIEINMIYDIDLFIKHNPWYQLLNNPKEWEWDIPQEERMHTVTIERDDEKIRKTHERVQECREWINENLLNIKL